jgi:hypothetical protein
MAAGCNSLFRQSQCYKPTCWFCLSCGLLPAKFAQVKLKSRIGNMVVAAKFTLSYIGLIEVFPDQSEHSFGTGVCRSCRGHSCPPFG